MHVVCDFLNDPYSACYICCMWQSQAKVAPSKSALMLICIILFHSLWRAPFSGQFCTFKKFSWFCCHSNSVIISKNTPLSKLATSLLWRNSIKSSFFGKTRAKFVNTWWTQYFEISSEKIYHFSFSREPRRLRTRTEFHKTFQHECTVLADLNVSKSI